MTQPPETDLTFQSRPVIWMSPLLMVILLLSGCGKKDDPGSKKSAPAQPATTSVTAPTSGSPISPRDPSPASVPAAINVKLVDVAADAGIDFRFFADQVPGRFFLVESMGGAAAWFDYDLDGHQDLYLTNGQEIAANTTDGSAHQNQLFRNLAGQFRRTTESSGSGADGYGFGVAVGDMNADGFADLYITNYGPNVLLQNNGDGTFSRVAAGVEHAGWGTGCVWFDANGDSWPDLYVANYLVASLQDNKVCEYAGQPGYCGPQTFTPAADCVYVNNGDGSFREATKELGFEMKPGYSLGVAAADLNGDHRSELIVASDMTPNSLFVRTPTGTWLDRAAEAGVASSGNGEMEAGMGIACDDFDGDGQFDFLLTHYFEKKNTLYRNLGDLIFTDESFRSRIAVNSTRFLGFGVNVIDVNRDAAPDLFVANGHVLGPNHDPGPMTAQVLLNDGRGRFEDISSKAGSYFGRRLLGRGSATADFDNDGDLDIAVSHLDQPVSLLQDQADPGHWIGLRILSPQRASLAGGSVVIRQSSLSRRIPLLSGGSYLSVSDARVLSALPEDGDVNVRITWPGGRSVEQTIQANRYWTIAPEAVFPGVR